MEFNIGNVYERVILIQIMKHKNMIIKYPMKKF